MHPDSRELDCRGATELFSAALDGEFDAGTRPQLELHLASCESCRAECAAFRDDVERLRAYEPRSLPASFVTSVSVAAAAPAARKGRGWSRLLPWGLSAAAAVVALLGWLREPRAIEVPVQVPVALDRPQEVERVPRRVELVLDTAPLARAIAGLGHLLERDIQVRRQRLSWDQGEWHHQRSLERERMLNLLGERWANSMGSSITAVVARVEGVIDAARASAHPIRKRREATRPGSAEPVPIQSPSGSLSSPPSPAEPRYLAQLAPRRSRSPVELRRTSSGLKLRTFGTPHEVRRALLPLTHDERQEVRVLARARLDTLALADSFPTRSARSGTPAE